jgi:hypothetical protein
MEEDGVVTCNWPYFLSQLFKEKKFPQENRNQAYAFLGELGYTSKEKVLKFLCNLSPTSSAELAKEK